MQTLLIGSVKLPEGRQRTSLDPSKYTSLQESIVRDGLLHAVILTEGNLLVAGATRLKAVAEIYSTSGKTIFYDGKEVPYGEIPYTFTHKTDEASIFRVELEENLRREQLSPQDEASALARLHAFMVASAPELVPGIQAKVTVKDTAVALGEITGRPQTNDQQRVADAILVDSYKDDPNVKRAKSTAEAVRAAKKAADREMRTLLGAMDAGLVLESRHRVLEGPCQDVFPNLADNFVDVIIADPPYGMGADTFGDQSFGHEYSDEEGAFWQVIESLDTHAARVCKSDAAMFVFMTPQMWFEVYSRHQVGTMLEMTDPYLLHQWYIWPTPLIWHKPNKGHAPQPKRGPSRRYEVILYAIRGEREVRKVGHDVLTFAVPDVRLHGAEKPVELYQELLSWVAYPGDVVLDPCGGSGTAIEAADRLDASSIVIEQDPGFVTICRERIEKLNKPKEEVTQKP